MIDNDRHKFSRLSFLLFQLGALFMRSYFGQIIGLFLRSMKTFFQSFRQRTSTFRQISWQIYFTGVEAVPLITLIAVLFGSVIILQALTVMPKVGFGDFFGNLMVVLIIRELGPILAAFFIAGRSGSALAAYLANMKVVSEVDALETMGIDPIRWLAMPAMVGGMVAVLMLTIWFDLVAIVAGFLVVKGVTTAFQELFNAQIYWDLFASSILDSLTMADFVVLIFKPLVFGAIIAVTACYNGLRLGNDVRRVPQATSSSVVGSFIQIVLADMVISLIFIGQYIRQAQGLL